MKIETKFNIGDEVWAMDGNKPSTIKIGGINIHISDSDIDIIYTKKIKYNAIIMMSLYPYYPPSFKESQCFVTKQELIDSL